MKFSKIFIHLIKLYHYLYQYVFVEQQQVLEEVVLKQHEFMQQQLPMSINPIRGPIGIPVAEQLTDPTVKS
jgi:hypothetical protein